MVVEALEAPRSADGNFRWGGVAPQGGKVARWGGERFPNSRESMFERGARVGGSGEYEDLEHDLELDFMVGERCSHSIDHTRSGTDTTPAQAESAHRFMHHAYPS